MVCFSWPFCGCLFHYSIFPTSVSYIKPRIVSNKQELSVTRLCYLRNNMMSFRLWDSPVPKTWDEMGKNVRWCGFASLLCWQTFPAPHTSIIATTFRHPPCAMKAYMKMTQMFVKSWCPAGHFVPNSLYALPQLSSWQEHRSSNKVPPTSSAQENMASVWLWDPPNTYPPTQGPTKDRNQVWLHRMEQSL